MQTLLLTLLFRAPVIVSLSCWSNLPLPLFHPGKLSEMKSTWSPGPISHSQASLSHELWKVPQGPRSSTTAPSRPPPGLTNTKPSSTWGGNSLGLAQGWSSSYTSGLSCCEICKEPGTEIFMFPFLFSSPCSNGLQQLMALS